jgi:hypothetical protein
VKNRSREVAARGISSTFPQHSPGFQRLHRRGRASGANTDVPRGQQWKPEERESLVHHHDPRNYHPGPDRAVPAQASLLGGARAPRHLGRRRPGSDSPPASARPLGARCRPPHWSRSRPYLVALSGHAGECHGPNSVVTSGCSIRTWRRASGLSSSANRSSNTLLPPASCRSPLASRQRPAMKVLALKSGSVLSMGALRVRLSVGHGNSDAPAGPTNGATVATPLGRGASLRTPVPLTARERRYCCSRSTSP